MCRVGKDVIPFDSVRDLSHEKVYSPNMKARGVPVLTVNSVVSGTTSNAGQGITSKVSQGSGDVRITSGSGSVVTNRLAQAYHLSDVQMNCQGSVCNTSGKLYTGTATPLKTARDNKQPCNQRPKTDAELEASIISSLRAGGMGAAQAESEAIARTNGLMDKLAALHEPDMVAGGWMSHEPTAMGRADVNSSIGGSWPQQGRIEGMDRAATDAVSSGRGGDNMNVALEPCRGRGMR